MMFSIKKANVYTMAAVSPPPSPPPVYLGFAMIERIKGGSCKSCGK